MSVERSGTVPQEQPSIPDPRHSRRHLMKLAAAGGLSLVAVKMFNPKTAFATTAPTTGTLTGGPTDGATQFAAIPGSSINEKILNFALTLETLEADLYRQALNLASGLPHDYALNVNPKVYTQKIGGGGLNPQMTTAAYLYLKEFTYIEGSHRDFLRAAITASGGTPVPANPGGYIFPTPIEPNLKQILTQILPLEETGVRAYLGALPYLTDLGLAQTAGTIYSTEVRHSAVVNYTLNKDPGPGKLPGDLDVVPNPPANNTFEYYLQPSTVVQKIQPFLVK